MSRAGGFPPVLIVGLLVILEDDLVHNTQFAIYLRPVSNRTGPFFRSLKSGQVQRFLKRAVSLGEYASLPIQLPVGGIQGFNRIGGINQAPYCLRVLEISG